MSLRWGAGGYSICYRIDIDQGTVWLLLVGLLSSSLVGWSQFVSSQLFLATLSAPRSVHWSWGVIP